MIYFTSSWDDGAIYDIKLSKLLIKHNHSATFYIPLKNMENRDVINASQIKELSNNFEIGAHTTNHVYLDRISKEEAKKEIEQSKEELELIISKPVNGFCFPGGKFRKAHLNIVFQAGYSYARTTKMFYTTNKTSLLNTTLQAYDHSRFTYYKHLLKRINMIGFFEYFMDILSNSKKQWDNLLRDILEKHLANDSVDKITIIHLWGHSWEIEKNNQWSRLESILELINKLQIETKTNYEISKLVSSR
ncbi:MAG: polysaccharide deacetylase family protein [Prolixibacteraceae bacterium]|nr:polysaccharide deacetylase family protein [Prolixibacteraceae bacterium]